MCSCNFRGGGRAALESQGFSTFIPSSSFISKNTKTYMDFMFWRCISESKFRNALNTIKVKGPNGQVMGLGDYTKGENEVKALASYADSGEDIKQYKVSLKKLLGSIKFDQKEINNAQCKVAFAND